jgi:serine protease Do
MRALAAVITVAALAAAPPSARADVLADLEQAQTKLFARVAPAVFVVGDERSIGTGFFVTEDGLALTAAHVVEGRTTVAIVLHGGKRARAKVVASRTDVDLALLQVSIDRAPSRLVLATRSDVRVGQWVGAVGHGLGGVWAFTTGMISNLYEATAGAAVVQTQIPLNPGNSGGPIFDRNARVVAVVSKGATNASSLNVGVNVANAFVVFDQLLPQCDCLAIDVPTGTAVFLDDELVGKGPRVLVRPSAGTHAISAVIAGSRVERALRYPADRHVVLR